MYQAQDTPSKRIVLSAHSFGASPEGESLKDRTGASKQIPSILNFDYDFDNPGLVSVVHFTLLFYILIFVSGAVDCFTRYINTFY